MENEISSLKTENKELLSRVKRLEAGSSENEGATDVILNTHPVYKREIDTKNKNAAHQLNRCANSANLCTFYYPDHPDQKRNINGRNGKVVQSTANNPLTHLEDVNNNIIPASCQDLKLIGHTLNGFYSVRGIGPNNNQIETIFCKFFNLNQPSQSEDFKTSK